MKLAPIQLLNIATGIRKVKEKLNSAITTYYHGGTDESSFYSIRGKRTHRGEKIN